MNTRIHYLYRDGTNCKRGHELVVEGELDWLELRLFLDEGLYFAPRDVGLHHPGEDFCTQDFPGPHDHAWCELRPEDLRPTADPPTTEITADELWDRFREAHACGWPDSLPGNYPAQ